MQLSKQMSAIECSVNVKLIANLIVYLIDQSSQKNYSTEIKPTTGDSNRFPFFLTSFVTPDQKEYSVKAMQDDDNKLRYYIDPRK